MPIRALTTVLALVFLSFCAAPASPPDTAAVERVIDDFHRAAASADEARYFGHLAEDSVFLGTDATERWSKSEFRAYAHPHFAKGKAWSFRATRRSVAFDPSGAIAWFDEDLATEKLGPARGSGVVARRDGRWQIVQYNLALTIPNDRFLLVAEAAGGAKAVTARAGDALADLAWLAGAWTGKTSEGEVVEELWMAPAGGSMIGSGRTRKDEKTTFFEHLRIEARPDAVVYIAQPLGRPPTEFTRKGGAKDTLVFENIGHDWPKRITYRRVAQGVSVRVEGGASERVDQFTLAPAVIARR